MGDHIGLGEVAGSGEALLHLTEKRHVQIHALITGAVEGANCRAGETAGGIDAAGEQHQLRIAILLASLLEQLAPGVFGIAEDGADELALLVVRRWRALRLGNLRLGGLAGDLTENLQRVLAHQQANDDDHRHTAEAQAAAEAPAGTAARIHHVVTASTALPAHGGTPGC